VGNAKFHNGDAPMPKRCATRSSAPKLNAASPGAKRLLKPENIVAVDPDRAPTLDRPFSRSSATCRWYRQSQAVMANIVDGDSASG
jgi:hypothetical protein